MSEDVDPLDVYAAVVAAIAAGRARDEVLAEHGLSEEAFDAIEHAMESEFDRATSHQGEDVPPFLQRYEAALRVAQQRALGPGDVPLETFAKAIAALERPGDPVLALERLGMKPQDVMRALGIWGERIAKDPVLAARFQAAKRRR